MPSLSELVEEGTAVRARIARLWRWSVQSDGAAWGHRPVARRQDGVHYALVHGLTRGGRFPVFQSLATGRIAKARLAPQPDDAVPRFAYERASAHADRRSGAGRTPPPISASCVWSSTISARAAPTARSRSTSSTIPANGCWICRCSARAMRNGRRRALRCRGKDRAAALAAAFARASSPRSIPMRRKTSRRR